jgi:predicted  nucleic acid-binding Zn-ribbon protein
MDDTLPQNVRPLPTWPIAVAAPACLASLGVLAMFVEGSVPGRVMAGVLGLAAVGVMAIGDRLLRSRVELTSRSVDEATQRVGELRETIRSREAEINRLQGDVKRRTTAFDAEKDDFSQRLAKVASELAESRAQLHALQASIGELTNQNATLQTERAEAIQRRKMLQAQYQDLEVTSRQLGASHTERTVQYRSAMDVAEQAKAELDRLRANEAGIAVECQRLRHQVERMEQELRGFQFRERALNEEVEMLRRKAADATAAAQSASAQRALHEELAARRNELDRLAEELSHQKSQVEVARERTSLAERSREEANATIQRLEEKVEASDSVIGELQDEVRNVSAEPRSDMAKHFSWRLNFFENQEVKLNFTNDGATVDLIDVFAEPAVPCAFEGNRRLQRGADGTVLVRPAKGAKLPDDFKLTVRYTLRAQSALFRLRPFSANKIERL